MKIETETIYVADDGARFKTPEGCQQYEVDKKKVGAIFSGIPESPIGHGSFLTVSKTILLNARRGLWKLVLDEYGEDFPNWKEWNADEVHPLSVVGRVLSDGANGPIEKAWHRMASWDFEKGRIYDQPYFVSHHEEAKEQQLVKA